MAFSLRLPLLISGTPTLDIVALLPTSFTDLTLKVYDLVVSIEEYFA